MSGSLRICLAGEEMELLAERALFWPRRRTMLISDTHWGKAATLRAAAVPIPGGTTTESLQRLSRVIGDCGAERLVLLGDVLHARAGRAQQMFDALGRWRREQAQLDVLVVRGNHDAQAGDPPGELGFRCVDAPWFEPPFVYRHHPKASAEGYTLCGHIHPAVKLFGRGGMRATLPCFWFGEQVGVLPAFGPLTGMGRVDPLPGDRVYAIAQDEIICFD